MGGPSVRGVALLKRAGDLFLDLSFEPIQARAFSRRTDRSNLQIIHNEFQISCVSNRFTSALSIFRTRKRLR